MKWAEFIFGSCLLLLATLLPSGLDAQAESHGSPVAGHITALLPEDHILRESQTLPAAKDMPHFPHRRQPGSR
jgi:hypothetical protein